MKKIILFVTTFTVVILGFSQNPSIVPDAVPNAFTTVEYIYTADEISIAKNLPYENVPFLTNPPNNNLLKLDANVDIYYSNLSTQCFNKKPVIILCHGNNENKDVYGYFAMDLSRRGYVVACLNFRSSFVLNVNNKLIHPIVTSAFVMDVFNCIKYITNNAALYNADPNYFIIGGFSDGALVALNSTFLSKSEIASLDPSFSWINTNTYYTDYDAVQAAKIKGVFALCGGVYDYNGINYITSTETTPVFFFSGVNDGAIPYLNDRVAYLTDPNLFRIYGGGNLAPKLKQNNSSFYLVSAKNVGHTFPPTCNYSRQYDFPNGYVSNWYPDMLSFLKNSVLCNKLNQFHKIVNCISPQCEGSNTTCTGANLNINPTIPTIINLPIASCLPTTTNEHCQAFSFDGGDYIKVSNSPSLTFDESGFDLEFWYKKTSSNPQNNIKILFSIGKDNNIRNSAFSFGIKGNDSIWIGYNTGINSYSEKVKPLTLTSGSTYTLDNNWHHYHMKLQSINWQGELDGGFATFGSPSAVTAVLNINNNFNYFGGTNYSTGIISYPYSNAIGQMDEIRLWKSGYSYSYNSNNICPSLDGLVGYWKLNQNNQIVKDETNFQNDGMRGLSGLADPADPTFVQNCTTSARISSSSINNEPTIEEKEKENVEKKEILSVFPNPSSGKPTILFISPYAGLADFQLLDNKGTAIINKHNVQLNNEMTILTDYLPNLASGIYFIKISTGLKTYEEKFVITK